MRDGDTWWLSRPDGSRFFSFGVFVVDSGVTESDFTEKNPAYCARRHYPDAETWANATLKRLREWGFTTIGGWSDYGSLLGASTAGFCVTPELHAGATAGAPWWDSCQRRLKTAHKRSFPSETAGGRGSCGMPEGGQGEEAAGAPPPRIPREGKTTQETSNTVAMGGSESVIALTSRSPHNDSGSAFTPGFFYGSRRLAGGPSVLGAVRCCSDHNEQHTVQ